MKMIIFVPVSSVKKHQLHPTLTSPVLPRLRTRLDLLHRAYEISSSWNFFDQETETIKSLLKKNSHPSYLINEEIKKIREQIHF